MTTKDETATKKQSEREVERTLGRRIIDEGYKGLVAADGLRPGLPIDQKIFKRLKEIRRRLRRDL
jgi:hypothetical protein